MYLFTGTCGARGSAPRIRGICGVAATWGAVVTKTARSAYGNECIMYEAVKTDYFSSASRKEGGGGEGRRPRKRSLKWKPQREGED